VSRPRVVAILAVIAVLTLVAGSFASFAPTGRAQEPTPTPPSAPSIGEAAQPDGTLPDDPQIQLVQIASGFADPVNVANAGDGSGRIFVVERIGRI